MKFIKNREEFLSEAKIKDIVFSKQADIIKDRWGSKFLEYEEVDATDKIKQGMWKLSDGDRTTVLNTFFDCDINKIFKIFTEIPDKFSEILLMSIDYSIILNKYKYILEDFDIRNPSLVHVSVLFDNIFRKLSVSETNSNEMIQKDENGRPMRDDENNMIKISKEKGDPIFERNLVNLKTFMESYNRCYDDKVNIAIEDRDILKFINLAKENHNTEYDIDFKILDRDIFLSIKHDPKQILNMSISTFYTSCQHLYDGGYSNKVLSNVFDPNTIPAFLIFDTPIYHDGDKISEYLPLSRMMIRNIETFNDDETILYFDRAYPDRMIEVISDIVEKYSDNKSSEKSISKYNYMPDIDPEDDLGTPYMDNLEIGVGKYVGKNTKQLFINRSINWSKLKISPSANIKELVIESEDVPENFFNLDLKPDWIKFKLMEIKSLSKFNRIKTKSIAFDKCKFGDNIIEELHKNDPNIERIQFISCDISGDINISKFKKLEELHVIYSIDDIETLKSIIGDIKLKKLSISGDMVNDSSKKYINSLKSTGTKVEIIGPVI
jgi:hypothetical protein